MKRHHVNWIALLMGIMLVACFTYLVKTHADNDTVNNTADRTSIVFHK